MLRCVLFWLCMWVILPVVAQQRSHYALLWEISGKSLKRPSYLFGSIHVTDKRAFAFSDSLLWKLYECEAFATEVHFDSLPQAFATSLFGELKNGLPPSQPIDDDSDVLAKDPPPMSLEKIISPAKTQKTKQKGKNFLRNAPKIGKTGDEDLMLDAYLTRLAKRHHKQIYGLEGHKEGDLLLQTASVEETNAPDDGIRTLDDLVNLYHQGDLAELEEWAKGRGILENKAFIQRNYIMLESIKNIMHERSLFAVVGAAHLVGEEGLLQLLRDAGYTVRRVSPTFGGIAPPPVGKSEPNTWYPMEDERLGFRLEMPHIITEEAKRTEGIRTALSVDWTNTGLTYLCVAAELPIGEASPFIRHKKSFYKAVAAKMKQQKQSEVLSEDTITVGGEETLCFRMRFQEGGEKYEAKIVLLLHRQNYYVLFVFGAPNSLDTNTDDERFFESFRFTAPPTRQKTRYTSQTGAFAVNLYEKPSLRYGQREMKGNAKVHEDLYMAISTRDSTREWYMVRYSDRPKGFVANDDILADFVKKEKARLAEASIKPCTLKGYAGVHVEGMAGKNKLATRAYMRGNRLYVLQAVVPPELDTQPFFDSFEFLPTVSPTLAREMEKDSIFSVLLPRKIKRLRIDETILQASRDDNSGDAYTITTYKIEPHVRQTAAKYLETACLTHQGGDSLIRTLTHRKNGIDAREMICYSPTKKQYRRALAALKHDRIAWVEVHGAQDILHKTFIDTIFSSIEFNAAKLDTSYRIEQSKASRLLAQFFTLCESGDTIAIKKMGEQLEQYAFDADERPILEEYLLKKTQHSAISTMRLLFCLERSFQHKDSLAQTFARLYRSRHLKEYDGKILTILFYCTQGESIDTIAQLMKQHPPTTELEQEAVAKMAWIVFEYPQTVEAETLARAVRQAQNPVAKRVLISFADIAIKDPEKIALLSPYATLLDTLAYASLREGAPLEDMLAGWNWHKNRSQPLYIAYLKAVLASQWGKNIDYRLCALDELQTKGAQVPQADLEQAVARYAAEGTYRGINGFLSLLQNPANQGFICRYFQPEWVGKQWIMKEGGETTDWKLACQTATRYQQEKGIICAYQSPEMPDVLRLIGLFQVGEKKCSFAPILDKEIELRPQETPQDAVTRFLKEAKKKK